MAHNPSYVGKTHVVTRTLEDEHSVIGVHDNYGSARNAIDEHYRRATGGQDKAKMKRSGSKGDFAYHHPEDEYGDLSHWYEIHREDGPGKWTKV